MACGLVGVCIPVHVSGTGCCSSWMAGGNMAIVAAVVVVVLGCARFPQFVQNFSERQILWSLCSVDFHTFALQLPIQTPHSVAPELQVFVSSLENCSNFRKTSTPLVWVKPIVCAVVGKTGCLSCFSSSKVRAPRKGVTTPSVGVSGSVTIGIHCDAWKSIFKRHNVFQW